LIEHLGSMQVMLISVLLHLLIVLLFAVTVFHYATEEPPEFTAGEGGFIQVDQPADSPEPVSPSVAIPTQQEFSAVAPLPSSPLPVITAAAAPSAFAMPTVSVGRVSPDRVGELAAAMPRAGGTLGSGPVSMGGGAGGGGFGTTQADDLKLSGIMYDLKQTRSRKASGKVDYYAVLAAFVESRFNPDVLKNFYRSSSIYTSHIFLPNMDAAKGPEAFGMERKIEPSNWFIHYQGAFSPPQSGRFRFWAMADDTVIAAVDGKVVIDVSLDKANPGRWAAKVTNFRSRFKLTPGDWMDLEQEKSYRLDLIVGERPGGKFQAYLLVEKEGEKGPKGETVRRLFTTRPLPGIPENPENLEVAPEPLVMTPRRSLRHLGMGTAL
jgi:hypothetical protein